MKTIRTIGFSLIKTPAILLFALLGCNAQTNTDRVQLRTMSMEAAIMDGNLSVVKNLQASGYDMSSAPQKPKRASSEFVTYTPLSLALSFRRREIAEYLLNQQVNVNATNSDGSTALLCAVQKWDAAQDMIKLLLDRGANLNVKLRDGTTPLNTARLAKQPDIVRLLLNRGALDPFTLAVLWFPQAEVDSAGIKHILYGVAYGHYSTNSLVIAVGNGDLEATRKLIEVGAGVDEIERNLWNSTPLAIAVLRNYTNVVAYLLDRGANINVQNQTGTTPLMLAVANLERNEAVVDMLIARGASLSVKDAIGCTALDYAILSDNTNAVKLLELDKHQTK